MIALWMRNRIYSYCAQLIGFNAETLVLDVGVTSDQTADSNFFEDLYPFPSSLTAVGLEDASFLEKKYPGLKFVRADALDMPFSDNQFDFCFCSAVVEHVGDRDNQVQLISELLRVGEVVVVTTPSKWFPLEFHTLTPFLHWLPPQIFRLFLRITGRNFFALEKNLNLLGGNELVDIAREALARSGRSTQSSISLKRMRLLGMTSNLVLVIDSAS